MSYVRFTGFQHLNWHHFPALSEVLRFWYFPQLPPSFPKSCEASTESFYLVGWSELKSFMRSLGEKRNKHATLPRKLTNSGATLHFYLRKVQYNFYRRGDKSNLFFSLMSPQNLILCRHALFTQKYKCCLGGSVD